MKLAITFFIVLLGHVHAKSQGVIFTHQVNNNDNLFYIDPAGETRQLTNHPSKDSSPMVSPDGKWVVFTSERVGWWKIWKMNLETKKATQLTQASEAAYSPAWSPDGQKIVFVTSSKGHQNLFVMAADGSGLTNISKSSTDDVYPFWCDKGFIYFSTQLTGTYQIARCRPDGSGREILTKSNGNKLMPQPSADLNKILYYGDASGNDEIYIIDPTNNEEKKLTNHPLHDMRPRWSPDGKKIVFERGNKGNNHHIFRMNADGSHLEQLTSTGYNYAASFIPRSSLLYH